MVQTARLGYSKYNLQARCIKYLHVQLDMPSEVEIIEFMNTALLCVIDGCSPSKSFEDIIRNELSIFQ